MRNKTTNEINIIKSLLILSYKDIKNNSFQNKILEFIQTTQI